MGTGSSRRRKRIRALVGLLKRKSWNFQLKCPGFCWEFATVLDPGALSVPHNLHRKCPGEAGRENFTTSRVFL